MTREATPQERADWGVPADAVCRVADGEEELVVVGEPGAWSVATAPFGIARSFGVGGYSLATGASGIARSFGVGGHAVATGASGDSRSFGVGGTERDSRSPWMRTVIPPPPGILYDCAVGGDWLRIGREVRQLAEWIEQAEKISALCGVHIEITHEMMDWAKRLQPEDAL